MRARRGPSAVVSQRELPWRQEPPAEFAAGPGPSGAQGFEDLPPGEGNPGGNQRTEPVPVAAPPGWGKGGERGVAALRLQRSFADGFIAEAVTDLWEPWMRHAGEALHDDQLLEIIQEELSKRCKKSKTRGRPSTTAEVVLRMLLLKHMRGWSYADVTREVRANLVYREFTGVGGGKVPDDKTMGRLARQLGPEAIEKLHRRTVAIAMEKEVVAGRRMRVDTTVVETNIHYPTDSTLMGDGVRVLTRVIKRVAAAAGAAGTKFRDRSRRVKRRVLEVAYAARNKGEKGQGKLQTAYGKLLEATSRVVGQAQKFSGAIAGKAKQQLDEMIPRVQQVMKQSRARVLGGNTRADNKILSM